MQADVILVMRRQFGGSLQAFLRPARPQISASQIELCFNARRTHTLKVRNSLCRRALGHQQQAQVVVPIAIRRIELQYSAQFSLGEIRFLLNHVQVGEIVVSLGGVGIELQGMLKHIECIPIFLLIGADNSQKVETLHTLGVQLELFLNLFLGLFDEPLLKKRLGFLEW